MAKIKLDQIKKKLRKTPLFLLSHEELMTYYFHRLSRLVFNHQVLVPRELIYFMGETGLGSLRLDPEIILFLTPEKVFADTQFKTSEYSKLKCKNIINAKLTIQSDIKKELYSQLTNQALVTLYSKYINTIKIVSSNPLIIEGLFNGVPILLITKNGEWLMPNNEIISFIKQAYLSNKQPILISKKIHGTLFPLFKDLSVIGGNTYTSFIPKEVFKKVEIFKQKHENEYPQFKYNERLSAVEETSKVEDNSSTNMLLNFLNIHLPKIINEYHNNFISREHNYNNIIEAVAQMKNKKAKKNINLWLNKRLNLLTFKI